MEPIDDTLDEVQALLGQGRFGESTRLAGSVIAAEPRNAKAWCLMARALLAEGRCGAALAAARAASSISPHAELPHRLTAAALIGLGRGREAVAAGREAVRFGPLHWETHHMMSQALLLEHHYNDARLAAEHAVRLAPEQAEPHVDVGLAARCQHRLHEARAAFERAAAIDPRHPTAQHHLVTLRHQTLTPGGLALAVNAFTEATARGQNPQGNRQAAAFSVLKFVSRLAILASFGAVFAIDHVRSARELGGALLLAALLYGLGFAIVLSGRAREAVSAVILPQRKLRLAGALEAVALGSALAALSSAGTPPGATAPLGAVCGCAALVLVQFARIGSLRDLTDAHAALVYRRNVMMLATIAGLASAVVLLAIAGHLRSYGVMVLAIWVPALLLLLARARRHTP